MRPTRRQFILLIGASAIGVACGKTGSGSHSSTAPAPGSISALVAGATQLSLLGTGGDAAPMATGRQRFGFALLNLQNQTLTSGSPQVWLSKTETSAATGPFPATWHPFTGYQ